jgi:hypothetical protein
MTEELDQGRPWMVANFPVGLRKQVTDAAKTLDVPVAQFLVAHFEHFGLNGVSVSVAKPGDKLDASLRSAPRIGNADLIAIASCPTIQKWLRAHAARELAERMGVSPPVSTSGSFPRQTTIAVGKDS